MPPDFQGAEAGVEGGANALFPQTQIRGDLAAGEAVEVFPADDPPLAGGHEG